MRTVRNIFSLMCAAIVLLAAASEGWAVDATLNPKQQSIGRHLVLHGQRRSGKAEKRAERRSGRGTDSQRNQGSAGAALRLCWASPVASMASTRSWRSWTSARPKAFPTRKAGRPAPCPRTGTATNTERGYGQSSAAGTPSPRPAATSFSAPVIDTFLKEHLFADIFARDNLDQQSRELATISTLASIPGLGGQLQFHMNAAMNTGLNEAQMKDFISVLTGRVGTNEAQAANTVLTRVLASRTK